MKRLALILFLSCLFAHSFAQSFLSLDSAIAIVLKNNYNILIAQNNSKIAANSYAPGEAGMLPDISIGAGISGSNNNLTQHYSTGLEVNKTGAVSTTIAPIVSLTWTLFDGTKMFALYNQLKLFRDEGILNLKASVQDNIASVIEAYYNIAQQKQLLAVADSVMSVYKEESDIAEKKYKIGMGSKLDFLQAEVSYNAERSAYLKQEINITNAIVSLNQLLELPVETLYNTADSLPIKRNLVYDSLKANMKSQNPALQVSQTNINVAEDYVKEARAGHLPTINLGLNYGLSQTQSNAGFALLNQSLGFSGGLTLTWTLFNGNIINIQQKNAEIMELNAKFQYSEAELQATATLLETYRQYEVNLKILQMDEENFVVAKENMSIAFAQFKIGTSNIVQLQQAQTSFATAGGQVVSDRYNAKVSETQLLVLAGQLIK